MHSHNSNKNAKVFNSLDFKNRNKKFYQNLACKENSKIMSIADTLEVDIFNGIKTLF